MEDPSNLSMAMIPPRRFSENPSQILEPFSHNVMPREIDKNPTWLQLVYPSKIERCERILYNEYAKELGQHGCSHCVQLGIECVIAPKHEACARCMGAG